MPDSALTPLAYSFLVACTACWLIGLVRSLRFVEPWLLAGKKPWACNVCMSFWTCGIVCGTLCGVVQGGWPLVAWGPAAGACLWMLESSGGGKPPAGL